ncbi:MAG: hypothetical protein JSW08_02700, partial [archaeon]
QLVNMSFTGITGATLDRGNNSAGNGQEQLYYCITPQLSTTLIAQEYNTTTLGSWTIKIT